MMKDEQLFFPASFFMVRIPILPIEDFFTVFSQTHSPPLSFLDSKRVSYLRESIAIASPSLYDSLNKKKENEETKSSLLNYFSRISSRSTPFGLFSFVSLGKWEKSTQVNFDLSKLKKRARPDMGWVFNLIDKISSDPQYFTLLQFKTNPLIFESTGRTCLNYFRKKNIEDETKTISIRTSYLTSFIFEMATQPILINELLERIKCKFQTLDEEKIKNLIKQLIQEQYLLVNLQPSLLTESPYNDLINKLSQMTISNVEFHEITKKINAYNSTQIGNGEIALKNLKESLRKMTEAKDYIQVDSFCSDENQINFSITKDLSDAIEVLWKISCESNDYFLRSYHKKFLEKYGRHKVVPLLELMHFEAGLGIPDIYLEKPKERSHTQKNSGWSKWLKNQWLHCLHQDKEEIELTDEIVKILLKKNNKNTAQPSLDVFCEIISNSTSEIDCGNYLLYILSNTWEGGATFGRFVDLFDDHFKEKLKSFYLNEENLEKESLFLQSSFLSVIPRYANVAIHPNLRRHAIDIEGSSLLSLNDIYVGVNDNRFFLTTKDCEQELIVVTGNLLSNTISPFPIRFIKDVSNSRYSLISSNIWRSYEDSLFLPRIRYKKVILSAARWKLDLFGLDLKQKEKLNVVLGKFHEWKSKWKIPRYVFLGNGDQRILMDLECSHHLNDICNQINNGEVLTFVEKIGQVKGHWIKSNNGTHVSEIVVPFIKNPKYSFTPYLPTNRSNHFIQTSNWKNLPGSEWLFLKFYLWSEQEDRFLTDQLCDLINKLSQDNLISKWFFIRYADVKPHLRIRFKGDKITLLTKVLPILHEWTSQLLDQNNINDMSISIYEKEVERYGGKNLIELAESVFCVDSIVTINLIQLVLSSNFAREIVGVLSILDLLMGLGMELEDQLLFFLTIKTDKTLLNGFRNYKSSLVSLGEAIFNRSLESYSHEGEKLAQTFQNRKQSLQVYAKAIQLEKTKGQLTVSQYSIFDSLIHMHCNRLLGTDTNSELKIRAFTYHTIFIICEKRKFHQSLAER